MGLLWGRFHAIERHKTTAENAAVSHVTPVDMKRRPGQTAGALVRGGASGRIGRLLAVAAVAGHLGIAEIFSVQLGRLKRLVGEDLAVGNDRTRLDFF